MTESSLFAERALLPDGWARDVLFEIASDGALTAVTPGAAPGAAPRAGGVVLPGMPNLHSHAFQRAMAGLAERAGPGEDSFWTWREIMYGFVRALTPNQVEAIAAQLYIEMLKAGYTTVGEFHYLHHDPEGRPYADLAEMSRRVIAAAKVVGIGITQLPVLYGYGDFGGQNAGDGQRRFLNDPDRLLRLVEILIKEYHGDPNVRVGIAPHSLRAVTPETLAAVTAGLESLDGEAPIHIHIAEQHGEVHDCVEWCGLRPVEWLLQNAAVGPRWCLVHATHVTEEEARRLAERGAVVGLCPTTEANLGDGVFPASAYLEAGGAFGIGSDSHISVSPIEELRWLEYGQRLTARRRNLLARSSEAPSVGARLFQDALAGGAQALGRPIGRLTPGARSELFLDALVFAGNDNPVTGVMVGGDWVVRHGRHAREEGILTAYKSAIAELTA